MSALETFCDKYCDCDRIISFYQKDKPYYELSNFYSLPFYDDENRYWYNSEAYFQAHKFTDDALFEKIRLSKSPRIARNLGQTKHPSFRNDWNYIKDNIMKKAILFKFTKSKDAEKFWKGEESNCDLALHLLKDSEGAILIEESLKDSYWGIGKDGKGSNKLGYFLMELRDNLIY